MFSIPDLALANILQFLTHDEIVNFKQAYDSVSKEITQTVIHKKRCFKFENEGLMHTNMVLCVTITPDDDEIISGCDDGKIIRWNRWTGQQIGNSLICHGKGVGVTYITTIKNGSEIISGGDDKYIRIWNRRTGQQIEIIMYDRRIYKKINVINDREIILIGDQNLIRWKISNGKKLFDSHIDSVTPMFFQPKTSILVNDTEMIIINCNRQIQRINIYTCKSIGLPIGKNIDLVTITPDGKTIIGVSDYYIIRFWSRLTGRKINSEIRGHTNYISCLAVTPDGREIISGDYGGIIIRWDFFRCKQIGIFKGHKDCITEIVATSDNREIISCSMDNTIRIWQRQK